MDHKFSRSGCSVHDGQVEKMKEPKHGWAGVQDIFALNHAIPKSSDAGTSTARSSRRVGDHTDGHTEC